MRWVHDLLNYWWVIIPVIRIIGELITSRRSPPDTITIPPIPPVPPIPPAPRPVPPAPIVFCQEHPPTGWVISCFFCGDGGEFSYYFHIPDGSWRQICLRCHRGYHTLGQY
jgi:hypothetical protein